MLHHAEPFRGGAGGVEVTSRRREGRTEEVGGDEEVEKGTKEGGRGEREKEQEQNTS